MTIFIDNRSTDPIYRQLYDAIKKAIRTGELSGGEMLPSIRNLAKDLGISVITTKRAYDELEKDGHVVTVAAKGVFVETKNKEMLREESLRELEEILEKVKRISLPAQIEKEEIKEMIDLLWEENNG